MDLLLSRIDNYRLTRSRQSSKRGRLGGYYETLFSAPSVPVENQGEVQEDNLRHKERHSSGQEGDIVASVKRRIPEWQTGLLQHNTELAAQHDESTAQRYSGPYRASSSEQSSSISSRPSTCYRSDDSVGRPNAVSNSIFSFQAPNTAPTFPQMPHWSSRFPPAEPETSHSRAPPFMSAPIPLSYQMGRADYFQPHRMPPHHYHYSYPQPQQAYGQPSFQGPGDTLQAGFSLHQHAPESFGRHTPSIMDPWRDASGGPGGVTLLDAIDWSKDFIG